MNPTFKQIMNDVVAHGSCSPCASGVRLGPPGGIDAVAGKPEQPEPSVNVAQRPGRRERPRVLRSAGRNAAFVRPAGFGEH